jgi:hypothetical protein
MTNANSIRNGAALVLTTALLAACNSSNKTNPATTLPPEDITISGSIQDGPVSGGSLFAFSADRVSAAMVAADGAADRAAALAAATPSAQLIRDVADGDAFSLAIPGTLAGEAVFFIFDSAGAVDDTFADQPFNLEAVVIAAAAGSQQHVNLSPHTTIASIQVRRNLDPDGDGSVIGAGEIQTEAGIAMMNALGAFGEDDFGEPLFPDGEDPASTTDMELLTAGSTVLGLEVRTAAGLTGLPLDDVVWLFAADAADGEVDGNAPASYELTQRQAADLIALGESAALGDTRVTDVEAVSCSAATASLRRACEFEALDEFFVGRAACAHESTEDEFDACMLVHEDGRDELLEECGGIYEARLEVCDATADRPHDPPFGPQFTANFVDPLQIGAGVTPNPFFPLVQGNVWEYQGMFEEDGEMITETITVTVLDEVKLIAGIQCLVVRDFVTKNGELVEDTDDWFAQDTDGNLWYCGEEVKDYETFEDDEPPNPELVAIDGAFKAGREGDEAGMLLPFTPIVGDVIRQEVSFTNAEDVIEILGVDADESSAFANCNGQCLLTRDFSPLDPGVEENKYYAPGIGLLVEIDLDTGDRVELVNFTNTP